MDWNEVKCQLFKEIEARGYDDHFIDLNEEREILQIALQRAVELEAARQAMAQICLERGYALESRLMALTKRRVDAATGGIDSSEFQRIFAEVRAAAPARLPDAQIQKLILWVLEDSPECRIRQGWLRNWHEDLRKQLGLG